MEQFITEILSGQSFVVIILVGAVVALWKSTQEGTKKLIEIIENNTKAHHEIAAVIEKSTTTTDQYIKLMQMEIMAHNKEVMAKLDFIMNKCKSM